MSPKCSVSNPRVAIDPLSERSDDPAIAATPEPRWPAIIAILVGGLVYASLPGFIAVGPPWLLLLIMIILEVPALLFWRRGNHALSMWLGYAVSSVLTLFVLGSLVLLVRALPAHKEAPVALLLSAVLLWVSNILTFALWYWRLDGGGPIGRDRSPGHDDGAFLFPQMTLKKHSGRWSPAFVDYLFLAFNTATAFSPTDVPILSRWAKMLVMLQSCISLTIIAILVGRAINAM